MSDSLHLHDSQRMATERKGRGNKRRQRAGDGYGDATHSLHTCVCNARTETLHFFMQFLPTPWNSLMRFWTLPTWSRMPMRASSIQRGSSPVWICGAHSVQTLPDANRQPCEFLANRVSSGAHGQALPSDTKGKQKYNESVARRKT